MKQCEQKYLEALKDIFNTVFKKTSCEILLFGSRATGQNTALSDIDIAIKAQIDISTLILHAKELIEDSNIPYSVDVVDYSKVSSALKHNISKDGVLIWKN